MSLPPPRVNNIEHWGGYSIFYNTVYRSPTNFEAAVSEVVSVVEAPESGLQGADGIAYGLDLSLVLCLERSTGHTVNFWNLGRGRSPHI